MATRHGAAWNSREPGIRAVFELSATFGERRWAVYIGLGGILAIILIILLILWLT